MELPLICNILRTASEFLLGFFLSLPTTSGAGKRKPKIAALRLCVCVYALSGSLSLSLSLLCGLRSRRKTFSQLPPRERVFKCARVGVLDSGSPLMLLLLLLPP